MRKRENKKYTVLKNSKILSYTSLPYYGSTKRAKTPCPQKPTKKKK